MWLFLFSSYAIANDAVLSAAAGALDKGQPKIAIQLLSSELEKEPTHPDLNLLIAVAYTRLGQYFEADEHFEYSYGARGGNDKYSSFYSDCLRVKGFGDEAADLRLSLSLVGGLPPQADVRIFTNMIDDYRAVGDLDKANDIHSLMTASFPNGTLTHIMAAELAMDENKLDDADYYLWLTRNGKKHWRLSSAQARLHILEARYQTAYDVSFRLGRTRLPSHGVNLRLEAARLSGDPNEIFNVLNRSVWEQHQAPEFLLSKALAHYDMNEKDLALIELENLEMYFPDNASYIDAMTDLRMHIENY
jgi:hypothetical protein